MRKFLIFLLCAALLCSALPVVSAEGGGHFILTALTAGQTLIAPCAIEYEAGQTLRQALLAAEPTFGGLGTGFITDVNGVAGNYTVFYDNGGYSLDAPAAGVTTLLISERESCPNEVLALNAALGAFNLRTDNVQNDPTAKAGYARALNALRSADAATAATLLAELNAAVAAYEAVLAGPKYTVTISATGAKHLTLTDAYGNVTETDGTQAQVVAGEYTFRLSDGGNNRTEGGLTVSGDVSKSVTLPTGQWFGAVSLRHTSGAGDYAYKGDGATYFVEDFRTQVYLNAQMGAVPDEKTTALYACYVGRNGTDYGDGTVSSNRRSWESTQALLPALLNADMTGRSFTLEARYPDADGCTQIQSYPVRIERTPTLAALTVTGDGTVLPLDFAPQTTDYTVTTVSDTLELTATAFGADGYTVTFNNQTSGTVSVQNGDTITVRVAHESGVQTAYTLHVKKAAAVTVALALPDTATTVSVYNAAGYRIAPVGNGTYRLIPGEKYSYISTKSKYFHTTANFTAAAGLTVSVAAPEAEDRLTNFAIYSAKNPANSVELPITPTPAAAAHEYTLTVPDANAALYAQATCTDSGYRIFAQYRSQTAQIQTNGAEKRQELTAVVDPNGSAKLCSQLLAVGGNSNTLTLRLQRENGGVTYYQEYTVRIVRHLTLRDLSLSAGGSSLQFMDADGAAVSFKRDVTDYNVRVVLGTRELTLNGTLRSVLSEGNPNSGGYTVLVNGEPYDALDGISVPLDDTAEPENLTLTVRHNDPAAVQTEYRIKIQKTPPSYVTVRTTPENAVAFLVNVHTGRAVTADADGRFPLIPGDRYQLTVTAAGYVGFRNEAYVAPEADETLAVALERAVKNDKLQDLTAEWPGFRADAYNNGVIDAPAPTSAEDAVLYWAVRLGEGFSADAAGCPIIVDDSLYAYAGQKIYRIDKNDGTILATGTMDHKSSFAINSPTYAEGMIFVGLADGCVQAFDAVTLEALWIYRDALGGQPNCPLVYHDGYLYTGFWRQETQTANFVCLSVTDEDPTRSDETKYAAWYYTSKGGFYWAGAYVCDRFALVPTDDGEAGYLTGHSRILSFNPRTGALLDELTLPDTGDARSSITFIPEAANSAAGTAYFTTKGGYFYSLTVDADGKLGKLRSVRLSNGGDDPTKPAMSTCTPTIYNGRAYVGVSGTSQFGPYSGHNLTVIDLAAMAVAYSVPTQGYPQTSGILTTAYDKGDGTVSVYFFDNYTPGKLRVLCDRPGQTEPLITTRETAVIDGRTVTFDTPYVLFTPNGAQAQYAICSPVIDADGTIYFKNDSAYLMAVGSVPTALEVTKQPDKTVYTAGEAFDPTGLTVTASYANGTTRDVTKYLAYSDAPLTTDDTAFQLRLRNVMYQNKDGAAGVEFHSPVAAVTLDIREAPDPTEPTEPTEPTQPTEPTEPDNPPEPPAPAIDFVDVPANSWYKSAVDYAVAHRLMNGVAENTFDPEGSMTRAMLVTVLWRYAGQPAEGENTFSDVPDGQWYSQAVAWAAHNGVVNGVAPGQFDPDGNVTREQMAVILFRYANKLGLNTDRRGNFTAFEDATKVSGYALDALQWAVAENVVGGSREGGKLYLNPQGNATRAEVATLLMRYIENILK